MNDVRQDMYIIKIDTQKARYLDFPEGVLNQTLILEKWTVRFPHFSYPDFTEIKIVYLLFT